MQTVKKNRITKPIRHMTVCRQVFNGINSKTTTSFPVLRLGGKWLLDSGFKVGHTIDVTCEEGKLTITLSKEQRYVDIQIQNQE